MSSAARKLYDSPVYSQERTISKPLVKKNVKRRTKAKERVINVSFVRTVLCAMALGIVFTMLVFCADRVTRVQNSINHSNAEINRLKTTLIDETAKLESLKNAGAIEFEARTKLGMIYPNESQILNINTNSKEEKEIDDKVIVSLDSDIDKNLEESERKWKRRQAIDIEDRKRQASLKFLTSIIGFWLFWLFLD
mgnify:CR=1 FL=1